MIYVIIINLRVVANLFCVTQKEMFCKTSMLHKNDKRNEWMKPFKSSEVQKISNIFNIFILCSSRLYLFDQKKEKK